MNSFFFYNGCSLAFHSSPISTMHTSSNASILSSSSPGWLIHALSMTIASACSPIVARPAASERFVFSSAVYMAWMDWASETVG